MEQIAAGCGEIYGQMEARAGETGSLQPATANPTGSDPSQDLIQNRDLRESLDNIRCLFLVNYDSASLYYNHFLRSAVHRAVHN